MKRPSYTVLVFCMHRVSVTQAGSKLKKVAEVPCEI
jgi:hypothetical protein